MNLTKKCKSNLPNSPSTDSEKSTISSSISKISWTGSSDLEDTSNAHLQGSLLSSSNGATDSKRPRVSHESDSDCELIESPDEIPLSSIRRPSLDKSGGPKKKQNITFGGSPSLTSCSYPPDPLCTPLDLTTSKQLPNLITNYTMPFKPPPPGSHKQNSSEASSSTQTSFTIAVPGPPPDSFSSKPFAAILSSNLGIQPPPPPGLLPPPLSSSPPCQPALKPRKEGPSKSPHKSQRSNRNFHISATDGMTPFYTAIQPVPLASVPQFPSLPRLSPLNFPTGLLPPPPPIPVPLSLLSAPSLPSRHADAFSLKQLLAQPGLLPPQPVSLDLSLQSPLWQTRPVALFLSNIGTQLLLEPILCTIYCK